MTEAAYQAHFDDGAAYERFMGQWSRMAGHLFVDWLQIAPQSRWLDVGCGTGAFTQVILAACDPDAVVGFDKSGMHLAYARSRINDPRVDFRIGDAAAIDVEDDSFDVAAAALVLNFVSDQSRVIAQMCRTVRPGGTVAAYVWDFAGHLNISQHLWDAMAATTPDAETVRQHAFQVAGSHQEALRQLFLRASLDDVRTAALDIFPTFASFDEYWAANTGFPTSASRYYGSLPPDLQNVLRQKLRDILPHDDKGQISFPARACAVRGIVRAGQIGH